MTTKQVRAAAYVIARAFASPDTRTHLIRLYTLAKDLLHRAKRDQRPIPRHERRQLTDRLARDLTPCPFKGGRICLDPGAGFCGKVTGQ